MGSPHSLTTQTATFGLGGTRIVNTLRRIGCTTFEDAAALTRDQLLAVPNLGERGLETLAQRLDYLSIPHELGSVDTNG